MNHETPNTPPVKLPHTLTHQVYALAVLYLYRLPLDSSGETKGCGWKRPLFRLASVWVHSEEGDGKSRSVCFSLSSQCFVRRPYRNSAAALSRFLSLLSLALGDVTAARAGLPWANTVRDLKAASIKHKIAVYCQLNCFCFI